MLTRDKNFIETRTEMILRTGISLIVTQFADTSSGTCSSTYTAILYGKANLNIVMIDYNEKVKTMHKRS